MKKIDKKVWIALCVVAVAIVVYFLLSGGKKEEKVSFDTIKVEKTDIHTSITATGTIEPVTSVTVGTQVSGIVSKLYVDYNSVVKKGQIIAELDRTNLISELNTAKANLTSSESTLAYEKANYNRYKTLYDKGLVSADDYESALLSFRKAKEDVNSKHESVKKAQTNLGYATITSPIDGVVLSKSVEEGQTVAASFNTPELFSIAQDLTDMRVHRRKHSVLPLKKSLNGSAVAVNIRLAKMKLHQSFLQSVHWQMQETPVRIWLRYVPHVTTLSNR